MSLNPFVALGSDPIGTLALLGYALALLSLTILATFGVWRLVIDLAVHLDQHSRWHIPLNASNPRQGWKWLPPSAFVLKVAAIPFIAAWAVWALGGLLWILTP